MKAKRLSKSVYNYVPVYKKSELDNGVRVVTETHPYSRAVSVGIFVDVGSRDEHGDLAGVTHFIEHLVFKGTRKRSAFEISKSMESVGGDLNAFTTRENTCFHATCLKEHFPLALEVLSDLIIGARFNVRDFEREKRVILQEIDMSKDSPEEYGGDLFFEKVYAGHPLGEPIAGTTPSVEKLGRRDLVNFYQGHYTGSRLVVSAAGPIDHEEVVEYVQRVLSKVEKGRRPSRRQPARFRSFRHFQHRPAEQVHLYFGMPSTSYRDPLRFDSYVANAILGGGMTSRLYQRVREKRGLVYSVYSYLQSFVDSGVLMVYAGASPKNSGAVMEIILDETEKLRKKPPGANEIAMYRTQLEGQILLGSEDMENRMNSLGVNELVFEKYRPVDQVIGDIDLVDENSVEAYLDKYFKKGRFSFLAVGDLDPSQSKSLLSKIC